MTTNHLTGRNDPCPCGSGKKYKKCCLSQDEALARQSAAQKASLPSPRAVTLAQLHGFSPVVGGHILSRFDKQETQGRTDSGLSSAIRDELEERWYAYDDLETQDAEAMDELLTDLLEFPPHANDWNNVFNQFCQFGHPDLPDVFRRIAAAVPHTRETDMGFLYWAAIEQFQRDGDLDLFPEVAAGCRKLDVETYDPDAVNEVETHLLAEGFEAEALEVAEHFLPIVRAGHENLLPGAVPEQCALIFHLRVGLAVREKPAPDRTPEVVAGALLRDLEPEIHPDVARQAAAILTGQQPAPDWTRAQFDLVSEDISRSKQAGNDRLRLASNLLLVAREAWELEQRPPARALQGLHLLLSPGRQWSRNAVPAKRRTSAAKNLFDYLSPARLDESLGQICNQTFGLNRPRARLVLEASGILLRFAQRHALIRESEAAASQRELDRWNEDLAGRKRTPSQ